MRQNSGAMWTLALALCDRMLHYVKNPLQIMQPLSGNVSSAFGISAPRNIPGATARAAEHGSYPPSFDTSSSSGTPLSSGTPPSYVGSAVELVQNYLRTGSPPGETQAQRSKALFGLLRQVFNGVASSVGRFDHEKRADFINNVPDAHRLAQRLQGYDDAVSKFYEVMRSGLPRQHSTDIDYVIHQIQALEVELIHWAGSRLPSYEAAISGTDHLDDTAALRSDLQQTRDALALLKTVD